MCGGQLQGDRVHGIPPAAGYPDQNPGASLGYTSLAVTAGANSYFAASDGIHGSELWVTDGQPGAAHTHQVADLRAGSTGSNPDEFASVNGTIYFRADDGVHGRQLYTSDGSSGFIAHCQ